MRCVRHIRGVLDSCQRTYAFEFSLRGKWPAERYQRILELLM